MHIIIIKKKTTSLDSSICVLLVLLIIPVTLGKFFLFIQLKCVFDAIHISGPEHTDLLSTNKSI